MLRTIGTCHCPFPRTDYSLPVSSFPPKGLFFLSCNDVISLDFRSFIHDSVIVKEVKNFSQGNPVSCTINRLLTSYLSPSKWDLTLLKRSCLILTYLCLLTLITSQKKNSGHFAYVRIRVSISFFLSDLWLGLGDKKEMENQARWKNF